MPALLRRLTLGLLMCVMCAQAIAADPTPARMEAVRLNNLGVAMMNQQLMEKAVAKFDAALKADPTLLTAQLNRGIALVNQQKLSESEASLGEVLKKDPANARAWYNLGLAHRADGNTAAAIDDFQHAAKLARNDPDVYYFLGTLYSQQQDYPKAIENFERALKLQPQHASAEFGLAKALQRSGKPDEAKAHLKIFEHLTQNKISSPLTLIYGEQGKLSIAQEITDNQPPVAPMVPVKFKPEKLPSAPDWHKTGPPYDEGGLCVVDINNDGKLSLIALGSAGDAVRVFLRGENSSWKAVPGKDLGFSLNDHAVACAVGDFDNDGKNDVAIATTNRLFLYHNDGSGKFTDVTKEAGITSANKPAGLTFVDYDHDGDLDLVVTGTALPNEKSNTIVWRNNGNKTFTNWTEETGLGGGSPTVTATLSDLNNDRAVDLVVTGADGPPIIYLNQREGKFKAFQLYPPKDLPPAKGAYVFDFNKDGWMDIALTHAGSPGVTLWKNLDGEHFERVSLPINEANGEGLTAIDFDNDGWIDLAAVVRTRGKQNISILRNKGVNGFEDVTKAVGLAELSGIDSLGSIVAADIDGDLAPDLIATVWDDEPIVLRNQGGNKNHAIRIGLKGLNDNKTAIGTKVEVFAGGLWQKFEIPGAAGYLSQSAPEILAGIGKAEQVDIVRMLWPTGVIQDEVELAAGKPVSFLEIDRRGSSCPTLFAWNGEKYEFISDVIGAAVMGHWISPTAKNIPDPDEWVKIEGSQIQPRDGYLSVRFGEPMEEANYIDQLRMVAVDHPAGTAVYPDERFLDNPPFASGKPVSTSVPHPPLTAWDTDGHDVTQLIARRDRQYVRDFTNLQYIGFTNTHSLTLDLGQWTATNPLRLFLSGFIEYFTATSMYAAWQGGIQPVSPYLEAQMPDGSWQRVMDDMGFPAGLPRTIVVDLTGKLPPGTRRVRISTNLQIYWDQVLVDNGPDRTAEIRTTELPLASATLGFRGYPQQLDSATTPGDLEYRYESASTTGPFSRLRGSYTEYGDVTSLLRNIDNHFVVFGTGEDVDAEFDTAALPPLPTGWTRDYFFYANGFVKDMDFYEATPFTVAQYPFHGMTAYPYPASERYPDDHATTDYLLEWNGRFETGATNASTYRFVYAPRQMDPLPLTPPRNKTAANGRSFSCAEQIPCIPQRALTRDISTPGGGR